MELLLELDEIPADLLEFFEPVDPAAAKDVLKWKPSPLKEAHYAAFGAFIPEFALKAGASAWGVCGECRAPYARVSSTEFVKLANRRPTRKMPRGDEFIRDCNSQEAMGFNRTETHGWKATCSCSAPRVPSVALDCFGGSGTTSLVADRLGHDAISIDLQPTYVDIARKRLHADQGLFAEIDG